ncbi:MAG TPA: SDR family NAD(P)-dependent oxidoreductase, partial [Nocardioides sp.]|nr:SDR family NAD(P)-dependent oxidoreductase [Nocardioides sp.]
GSLTGVVNNAGATFHVGTLAETPVEVIRRTVDLNLTGAILVARAAVRALSTEYGGHGGVLVNISSGAATKGSPGEYVHYAAAKAGVDALTLGLAEEVAQQGVRVVG